MAYSIDFVKKAVAYRQKGKSFKQLREAFGIPPETYCLWKRKLETGYCEIKKPKQERRRKIDKEPLRKAAADKPDAHLHELAVLFDCAPQAIFYMLAKLNITLKKRRSPIMKNRKQNARNILPD
jgi:transposase